MTLILPFAAVLVVLFALAAFVWFWWLAPRDQVPPHLTELELRRLEVEDRLRQTNYQILTALGLGATFIATVVQLSISGRQWSQDFQLRTVQERLGRYADALKALSEEGAPAKIAGIGSLFNLALQDPAAYHFQVNDVLSALVRHRTRTSQMSDSVECDGDASFKLTYPRSEALPEVQAAMTALGNRQFALYRDKFSSGACESWSDHATNLTTLRLDHRYLDELDLSAGDFSCAGLSQSQLHRVSFSKATLRGTDFRGARIADFETPHFPEDEIGKTLYGGQPTWKRYRCWVTDFRGADLTNANFEGAAVAGADFRGADLTRANFCRADVSRANFDGAKGLKATMLKDACVGDSNGQPPKAVAQPFGVEKVLEPNFLIPRCPQNPQESRCVASDSTPLADDARRRNK
jgi:uncharacterized protein YjbI with pentapeptide repeats